MRLNKKALLRIGYFLDSKKETAAFDYTFFPNVNVLLGENNL